jgi:peptidoglycan hydrolase CwlO-like protein
MVLSVAVGDGSPAQAQSVGEAEDDAAEARQRADVASGLVDEAVAERRQIEVQLTETITRVNDLAARLSVVGAGLDRTAEQLGYADAELAGIKSQIEVQAVDAYMTVLSSPTATVVNSASVEEALVASTVVEDVVSAGRNTVDQLVAKRRSLEDLQADFLGRQDEFQSLQDEVNVELQNLTDLYAQADAAVAEAASAAQQADAAYREALSAVDLARSREEERRRQEQRSTTTTSPTTTTSGGSSPTTTTPANTTTTSGGGQTWDHPPAVERWRPLVEKYFPTHRVEEALRILNCESNGDPDAYNPYSGASGLFQFLASTWATTAPQAGWAGHSVFEPEPNVSSAAWLANRYEELGSYYWQAWSCRRVLN